LQRTVVVVGAGPAGMAAAVAAVTHGCRVTVIDEAALPGGQIYRQAKPVLDLQTHAEATEIKRKQALLGRFAEVSGELDYRAGATAYALFPNGELHVALADATEVMRPDAIVLATGVREHTIPFPGWTTPGVMFAGGAQAFLKSQGIVPGKRAVVAGCGPLPTVVAAQLIRAGGSVAVLANLHPIRELLRKPRALWHGRQVALEGMRYAATVLRAGVRQMVGHVPTRAIGGRQLEAVVLCRVDADGRTIAGSEREIACDLLAVNYGFVANSELVAMAGAEMRWDGLRGGWLPVADEFGRTSVPKIFVAGDGAGLRGALVAECEGAIVGHAAATPSGGGGEIVASLAKQMRERLRHVKFQEAVAGMLRLPPALWHVVTDDTIVCRCENVTLAQIRLALDGGQSSLNTVKRKVRAGMGWCGGRGCQRAVAALLELHGATCPSEMSTPRPMARPVSFAAISRQRTPVEP
jgi:D-hydroxyproline dehydrogenase subunit alpha